MIIDNAAIATTTGLDDHELLRPGEICEGLVRSNEGCVRNGDRRDLAGETWPTDVVM